MPSSPAIGMLAVNDLMRTFGRGTIAALLPLHLHRFGGLSGSDVAFAAGLGGAIGVVAALPAGRVIDRIGSKPVAIVSKVVQGIAIAAMASISGFAAVVTVFAVMIAFDTIAAASGGALVAHAVPREERVRARAYLRALGNIGVSAGVACGGIALASDSRSVHSAVLVTAGLLTAGSALAILGLHAAPARSDTDERPPATIALKDGTYVTFVVAFLVLTLNQAVLTLGLPLYLAVHTEVPEWAYSPLLIANTVLVIVLQVRLSKSSETPAGARRAVLMSGYLFAGSMVLLIGAMSSSLLVAAAALGAFVLVLTIAEIIQSAGGWGLSYHLAPEHSHGAYQGLFAAVTPVTNVVGPLMIGAVLIPFPAMGAFAIAGMFLLATVCLQVSRGLVARTEHIESAEGVRA
jgi:MFS family permease